MTDEDKKTIRKALNTIGSFNEAHVECGVYVEKSDYSALIKAAEDILKIAGAR
ncbi:hypothetical protein [Rhizobium tubonense]|uniref:hypothetical protein n=1 Tax=Rhizobium tubonense TaxID=484088 RepID=UPI0012B69C68|nr:hypothetical protein [Rhizobium tubonense]